MNKLSKKSIRIGAGILAILILMAGLLVFIGRKYSMRGELETLRIETREMNQDFSEEYQKKDTFSEYSESIRQKKAVNKEGFMPIEEIRVKLKELPDHFAEIAQRDDLFAITYGSARVGQAALGDVSFGYSFRNTFSGDFGPVHGRRRSYLLFYRV